MTNTALTPTWAAKEFLVHLAWEFDRLHPVLTTRPRRDLVTFSIPVEPSTRWRHDQPRARYVISQAARAMARTLKRRHIARFYEAPVPVAGPATVRVKSKNLGLCALYVESYDLGSGELSADFRVLGAPCHR